LFTSCNYKKVDLLIISGEASGDEHASLLVKDLKARFPDLSIAALGGKNLERSGAHLLFDLVEYAVVGVVEVLKNYRFFKRLFNHTLEWITEHKPKAVLLVDYPGFNLRLAHSLKQRGLSLKGSGDIKVLQYVSPQLWAWKPKRRFKMAKVLDSLAVIFPFELDCYKDVDLPVSFVGHPFVSEKHKPSMRFDRDGPLVLLPGSRVQPVQRILPVFLDACEQIIQFFPELEILLPVPDSQIKGIASGLISQRQLLAGRVQIKEKHECKSARAALMSSGTMSFACALAGIPGVIAYKAHPLTYFLGKMLVRVPYLGMANLLLPQNPPYCELIQGEATGSALFSKLKETINHGESTKKFLNASLELRKILSDSQDLGVVDWLTDELELG
jgi:lipid-A-disaccharide synthase